jgi:hypothetical protein
MPLSAAAVVAAAVPHRFDRLVNTKYPANVLSGFEQAAGATFFNLNQLQDEYRNAPGTVITAGGLVYALPAAGMHTRCRCCPACAH